MMKMNTIDDELFNLEKYENDPSCTTTERKQHMKLNKLYNELLERENDPGFNMLVEMDVLNQCVEQYVSNKTNPYNRNNIKVQHNQNVKLDKIRDRLRIKLLARKTLI